jgi:hypothetical protein
MANRVGVCLAGWAATIALAGCVPGVNREYFPPPLDQPPRPPRLIGPRPDFGRLRTADTAPPPISGGTLAALRDGQTAVAADPDRDRIFVVDYLRGALLAELPLEAGDEPGRVIEDADGRVHVALRRGGAVVTLLREPWRIAGRRAVCTTPRGMAHEPGVLYVACADGQLVSLDPAPDGAVVRRLDLMPDLRDVVVDGNVLLVSRFRSADVLTVDRAGAVIAQSAPPNRGSARFSGGPDLVNGGQTRPPEPANLVPAVAWRLVGLRPGESVLLHQRALDGVVDEQPGGYGGDGCTGGIVESSVSGIGPLAPRTPGPALGPAVAVAVDVAVSPDRQKLAVVTPAAAHTDAPQLQLIAVASLHDDSADCRRPPQKRDAGPPAPPAPAPDAGADAALPEPIEATQPVGEATAVAFDPSGHLLVQTREPATVQVLTAGRTVLLSRISREDTGHAIFHANSGAVWPAPPVTPRAPRTAGSGSSATPRAPSRCGAPRTSAAGLRRRRPSTGTATSRTGRADDRGVRQPHERPAARAEQVGHAWGAGWTGFRALPALPPRDPGAVERGAGAVRGPGAGLHALPRRARFTPTTPPSTSAPAAPLQVPTLRGLRWRRPTCTTAAPARWPTASPAPAAGTTATAPPRS